jgi:hypothetical protein
MCGKKFELSKDNSEVTLELPIDHADAARARTGGSQGSATQAGWGENELEEINHPLLLRGGVRDNEGSASDENAHADKRKPRFPPMSRHTRKQGLHQSARTRTW